MSRPLRIVGLMSGTSADGIDVAVIRVEGTTPERVRVEVEAVASRPWPDDLRARILAAAAGDARPADLSRLRVEVAEGFGAAVVDLLESRGIRPAAVDALACHGQTVRHDPPEEGRRGWSLQLLDAATLAALCRIPVVHDFRAADLAAGGHGAPLVPFADALLFRRPDRTRIVLNLGGMANLTRLPPTGNDAPVLAFDTGPGNALLDLAAARASQGTARFDVGGERAARGSVDHPLVERLLADPFFDRPPPRSTGRERFGPELLDRIVAEVAPDSAEGWDDLLATLTEFTAASVAGAIVRWAADPDPEELLAAGGGIHNRELMRRLADRLAPLEISTGPEAFGFDPDAREAVAFALLGWAFLRGLPGNLPGATGASAPRLLGSWTPAPGRGHPDFGAASIEATASLDLTDSLDE